MAKGDEVLFDPVEAEDDPQNAGEGPVFDGPVEVVDVSGDSKEEFVAALKRLGVVTPMAESGTIVANPGFINPLV